MSKKQQLDLSAPIKEGKLGEVIIVETKRPDGSVRIQQDFEFCPTMTEQHTAHLSDLNYLIERYKPDELAAYMAARAQYRTEILGHDFASEMSMQDAYNVIYESKSQFEALPDEVRLNFRNHLEFLKFIDNPANAEKMQKLGLLTPQQVEKLQGPGASEPEAQTTTPQTKDKKEEARPQ